MEIYYEDGRLKGGGAYAGEFFGVNREIIRNLTLNCRIAIILLNTLLVFLALQYAHLIFGWAGVLGALGAILSPAFLAHSRYVTLDVPVSLLMFLSIVSWQQLIVKQSAGRWLIFVTFLTAAFLSKFISYSVLPVIIMMTILISIKCRSFARLNWVLSGIVVSAALVVSVYAVTATGVPEPFIAAASEKVRDKWTYMPLQSLEILPARLAAGLRWFSLSFTSLYSYIQEGRPSPFLFGGQLYWKNTWLYFPLLFLLKETLPGLILVALAIFLAVIRPGRLSRQDDTVSSSDAGKNAFVSAALFFTAFYIACAVASHLNVGLRHLLPVYLFAGMLTAYSIEKAYSGWSVRAQENFRLVLVALLLVHLISITRSYPHLLSYYNEAAGGTDLGYKWAVDSNYDWGQDFYRLTEYLDKTVPQDSGQAVYLTYFGPLYAAPSGKTHMIKWPIYKGPPPEGSLYAVSVHAAEKYRAYLAMTGHNACWLDGFSPLARAGKTIFVYRIGPKS